MATCYDALLEKEQSRLKDQSHVFKFFKELNDSEKDQFIHQIKTVNPERLQALLKESLETNQCEIEMIEQIPFERNIDFGSLSKEENDQYFNEGLKSISKSEVAALVLAGGQASRLCSNIPKGTLSLGIGFSQTDSLLFIQTAQLCRLIELAEKQFPGSKPSIPWLVMTSQSTDEETRKHMKKIIAETGFPENDVLIFSQNEIPTLDFSGKMLLKSKGLIATNPDGNGGIYEALNPFLPSLEAKGVKYIHTFSVDNILGRVADPLFVGACVLKNADCAAKTIEKKDPHEPIGNFCLKNGRVCVVEYLEITKELAERRDSTGKLFLRAGNIANHVFSLSFLKQLLSNSARGELCHVNIPFHVAKKKVPYFSNCGKFILPTTPNAYKLERFIFDAFVYSQNFLICQVSPSTEFSPLKNSNDVGRDCMNTCLCDLAINHLFWVESSELLSVNEFKSKELCLFISPLLSYKGEGLNKEPTSSTIINKIQAALTTDYTGPKNIVILPVIKQ